MSQTLRLLMAQINPYLGAIPANAEAMIKVIKKNQSEHDLIIFPELAITGYPPEDLLLRSSFYDAVNNALEKIQASIESCYVLIGHPHRSGKKHYNAASLYFNGKKVLTYHKQYLPNNGVFDEERYFDAGKRKACTFTIKGHVFGIAICEDIWYPTPVKKALQAGVQTLLCINASPFDQDKYAIREKLLQTQAKKGLSIVYVNQVGGQDELVFDGLSMVIDNTGKICARSPAFQESYETVTFKDHAIQGTIAPLHTKEALIYEALICGLKDYVRKNQFPGILLGLSGGIDSALTLALAVDALGPEKVHAVMMPSRYTAQMSLEDAKQQALSLQVNYRIIPIEPTFDIMLATLKDEFLGKQTDVTEENLQARIRGMILMALSNKHGQMVLSTSNKSETTVGYATLYGDMAGGFSILKDVLKTEVYALAKYRNTLSPVIPERVITRPPSAELAFNQKDQDSLPEYEILDAIIRGYMENNLSEIDLINQGFDSTTVHAVIKRIARNEYKRRQASPGIKISTRAFGRDWRYPITSGFVLG